MAPWRPPSACSSSPMRSVSQSRDALAQTSLILRITTAAGALVLAHNFYGQAAPASRSHIRLAMLGLSWMWIYDLNLYTISYIGSTTAHSLFEWRGVAVALTAPLFALGRAPRRAAGKSDCRARRRSSRSRCSPSALISPLWRSSPPRCADRSRLVGDLDDRRTCGDDRRRHGPDPERPCARLGQGRSSPSICSNIATTIEPSGCASPTRWAVPARTRRRSASGSSRLSPTLSKRRADCCWSTRAAAPGRRRRLELAGG